MNSPDQEREQAAPNSNRNNELGVVIKCQQAGVEWNTRAALAAAPEQAAPEQGSLEDFTDAADLVDKLRQAQTNGAMLGLVLAYRKAVRAAAAKQATQAPSEEGGA